MATDRYLISLASSCIGSFRGEPGIELQASQSMQSAGGVHAEHPDRSTPSAPVLQRAGVERRQTYLEVRHHVADMARAAEPHECGRCALKVFPRFVFIPLDPALYARPLPTPEGKG